MSEPEFLSHIEVTETKVPEEFLIYDTENFSYVVPKGAYQQIMTIPEGSVQRQSEAFFFAYLVIRKADKTVTKSRWF